MFRLLLPKRTLPYTDELRELPLFFLAGPILGGGDWQADLTLRLAARVGDCVIVNPSRYENTHPLFAHHVGEVDTARYPNQKYWEREFLRKAGSSWKTGCLIFWLAKQQEPRTDGNPYAIDTLGEIGEWRGHAMHDKEIRMAVGVEDGFPGLKGILRDFEHAFGNSFPIFRSMDEVVEYAAGFADPASSFSSRVSA